MRKTSCKNISFWQDAGTRFYRNKAAISGALILIFLIAAAIFLPLFSSHTYYDIHPELKNSPPSACFLFGTDELGRDIFIRTWYGARISLAVGITAAAIDVLIGVLWGMAAACSKRWLDEIMMRTCDVLCSVPYLLIVLLLLVAMKPGFVSIVIALTFTGWINMARIIRTQALLLTKSDLLPALQSLGASKKRIIFRHLIPNSLNAIIATVALTISTAIFTEAFLSFLGLGIQSPNASLGVMINESLPALSYYPWKLLFPASVITLIILGFNLFGDGLRESLDPRLRK